MKKYLTELFEKKEAVICIVGLGYVGIPIVKKYLEAGFSVIGIDIDKHKVNKLWSGVSPIKHLNCEDFPKYIENKKLHLSYSYYESDIKRAHAIIICVPTPLTKQREPDLTCVKSVCESITPYLKPGHIISLESTTYPGTTEDVMMPIFAKNTSIEIDADELFIVYSPEREDPGNKDFDVSSTPKVIGALNKDSLELGTLLYKQIVKELVPVSSLKAAEMVKILENTYRAVNIALVNELKIVCEKMDLDVFEIINAAKTKPYGYQAFYPGPGLGGHCIPIDPFYLTWKAREYDVNTEFIELAGKVNTYMPHYVVQNTLKNLYLKNITNKEILIVGITYKPNVDDLRESPALKIMEELDKLGFFLSFYDPYIKEVTLENGTKINQMPAFIPLTLSTYACAIIVTNHSDIDYEMLRKNSKLVIDTRGIYPKDSENVVKS